MLVQDVICIDLMSFFSFLSSAVTLYIIVTSWLRNSRDKFLGGGGGGGGALLNEVLDREAPY